LGASKVDDDLVLHLDSIRLYAARQVLHSFRCDRW
jgi:hypothetical protein